MLHIRFRNFYSAIKNDHLQKLLIRTPKSVTNDQGEGFLARIFQQSKRSPTYILLKELFAYLQQSSLLSEEFPFLKSEARFQENWMALHLQILKSRLRQQRGRSEAMNELELQKLNYNAQVYFFPSYAKYLNPQTPSDYASHFSEAYLKRFLIYDEQFLQSYESHPNDEILNTLLRRLVYENRVPQKDAQLLKLSRYYLAHVMQYVIKRRYLSMLEWPDLVGFKVKWGFEAERGLLESLGQ